MVTTSSSGSAPLEARFDELRAQFPILDRKIYLNSNSLGALSRRSMAERSEFEELWNEFGASAWYEIWLAKLDEVRAGFGQTIGAELPTIALMPSVSAALTAVSAAVLSNLKRSNRNKVVLRFKSNG